MPSRLKSLELHGYKTFASRTQFEFSSKVTAVVGPNGSGKSNIADSLRWVLGEQSYSLLRGKKTEDMIFSGSEQRTRAGMASATVIFDNSDGWLPIDYNEVAITRRAYRDGTNEYLVNGQKIRLRDVSELLAQSGLAERTYTIIGQGVVDAALALKAEERRRLFEEAAGIGLHRSRREEALRRLETTRRNLERVEDILAELQPRLRSLERQARRLLEYEQVRTDLQVLLREWYGYHWHRAQEELLSIREIARERETALERIRQDQSGYEGKVSIQRESIQTLRAQLNVWHRELSQLHLESEKLNREGAVSDERDRSLGNQLEQLNRENAHLDEERKLHQESLSRHAVEVARLEVELQDARQQVDVTSRALQARGADRSQAEKALQQARQSLSEKLSKQGQANARLSELQSQLRRAEESLQTAEQTLIEAQSEHERVKKNFEISTSALQKAVEARTQAASTLTQMRHKLAQSEDDRKQLLEQRSSLSTTAARLQTQIDVLDQAEAALSGYSDGAQALIKAMQAASLKSARGVLSGYLQVPDRYEIALAAALGEFLDAMLLEHASSADQALDLLSSRAVRGVIVPLDELSKRSVNPRNIRSGGAIGWAIDLIQAQDDVRPVLELLLGQTMVVEDRSAALAFIQAVKSSEQPVKGFRAVTLRGELFHAGGPIIFGAPARPAALSRPRQRKELAEQHDRAEQRLAGLDADLEKSQLLIEQIRNQSQRAQLELDEAVGRQEKAHQTLEEQRAALEGVSRQIDWVEKQRGALNAQQKEAHTQVERLTSMLSGLEKDVVNSREQVRQCNTRLGELSLDDLQAEAAHWAALADVAQRTVAEAANRRSERLALQQRAEAAIRENHARAEHIQRALKDLQVARVERKSTEGQLAEKISSLNALIEPAEAKLSEEEGELEKQLAAESSVRHAASQAEHQHAQAKINLAKKQEALDTWRRRIEDDFGLVAFEYEADLSGPTPLPLEGMVEQLPRVTRLAPEIEENVRRQRAQLRRMGPINPEAQAEYQEVKERYHFMTEQVADLHKAEADVREVIAELDDLMQRELRRTFEAVSVEFKQIFTRLFGGGTARLVLTDPEDMSNTGIDIEARLPGRRSQGLSLLSGGERSLTATSLIFALLKVSPTPFCVLDEVDAMLDEANVGRFRDILSEFSQNTQFIVVTHNRNTVQVADVIYGVTMGRDSASQVISLKLDEVEKIVAVEQ